MFPRNKFSERPRYAWTELIGEQVRQTPRDTISEIRAFCILNCLVCLFSSVSADAEKAKGIR